MVGVGCGVLVILWVTFSNFRDGALWPAFLADIRSPLHSLLSTAVGTLTVLMVGGLMSCFSRKPVQPTA
jgi:hypothetical protein